MVIRWNIFSVVPVLLLLILVSCTTKQTTTPSSIALRETPIRTGTEVSAKQAWETEWERVQREASRFN